MPPRIIVFDVNETLLDVGALEPHFARAFGDPRVLREWFSTVLLYSEVASLAGPYSDFGTIGGAALDMTAASRGTSLSSTDRRAYSDRDANTAGASRRARRPAAVNGRPDFGR